MPNAVTVEVSGNAMSVKLSDGQMLPIPVDRYPRLAYATEQQRANWRIIGRGHGIHWEDVDEDISVEGLRSGKGSGESASSLMKWFKANFPPRFCPWQGPEYGKRAKLRLPARLLILGESHYDRDGTLEEGGDTKGVVDDYLEGDQHNRHKFFYGNYPHGSGTRHVPPKSPVFPIRCVLQLCTVHCWRRPRQTTDQEDVAIRSGSVSFDSGNVATNAHLGVRFGALG